MPSPKHLWSGDWERESDAHTPPPPSRVPAAAPAPAPEPAPARRLSRASLVSIAAAAALVCIVAIGLAIGLPGGSSKSNAPSAQAPAQAQVSPQAQAQPTPGGGGVYSQTTPQPTTPQPPAKVVVGPIYNWLGMQIVDSGQGPTVATVAMNSVADNAGIDPGDVITAVNGSQINSAAQLAAATQNLKLGQRFEITDDRDTTVLTITATLAGRPTRQS